jgi:hypothetical protein
LSKKLESRRGGGANLEADNEENGIGRSRFFGSVVASEDRAEVGDGAAAAWQRQNRRRQRIGGGERGMVVEMRKTPDKDLSFEWTRNVRKRIDMRNITHLTCRDLIG